MFNLDKFISGSVTFRPTSMFEPDIKAMCWETRDETTVDGASGSSQEANENDNQNEKKYNITTIIIIALKTSWLMVEQTALGKKFEKSGHHDGEKRSVSDII